MLALKNLRVNQIPDVAAAGDGGQLPVSGRIAGNRRARDHQPRREVAAEHSAGLRDPLDGLGGQRAASSSSSTSRRTCRRRRRDPQRHRLGALQAAARDARAGAVPASIPPRSRSCIWRCRRTEQSHAEISRLAEDVLADRLRGIDGVAVGQRRTARCSASCRCCCTRRNCASTTFRWAKWSMRCARRTPPRRWAASRARSTSRTSAWSAASSRRREFNDIVVQARRAMKSCGWARWPPSRTVSPSRAAISLRNAPPERGPVDHPFARRQHRVGGRARAQGSRGDQQDAARRAPSSRSRSDGGEEAASYLQQRDRGADLRRRPHDFRGLRVPEFLALDADHRPVAADLGHRGVHRRVAVRLHAELHDAAGPVAGDRRAHR